MPTISFPVEVIFQETDAYLWNSQLVAHLKAFIR